MSITHGVIITTSRIKFWIKFERQLKTRSIKERNVIQEEMSTLVAEVRYDIAYADLQNAYADIFAAVGIDDIPKDIEKHDIEDLSALLKDHFEGMLLKEKNIVTQPEFKRSFKGEVRLPSYEGEIRLIDLKELTAKVEPLEPKRVTQNMTQKTGSINVKTLTAKVAPLGVNIANQSQESTKIAINTETLTAKVEPLSSDVIGLIVPDTTSLNIESSIAKVAPLELDDA